MAKRAAVTRLDDWLAISTEGFAQRQADRKPEHLFKELIQNALDATDEVKDGRVDITLSGTKTALTLVVTDNGSGIDDPNDLRTVFCSGKEDRATFRGRMGQGAKEILCLCTEALVLSQGRSIKFHTVAGKRVTDIATTPTAPGTVVTMTMPWPQSVQKDLQAYLRTLIIPANRIVTVNGTPLDYRQRHKTIDVTARTEVFADGKWVRRPRKGTIDLVPLKAHETPSIYEMGIPIQEIDWRPRHHINVQMRVPMNPRRDAVAAGYLPDLYRQILPVLMKELAAEDLRDEWVSLAVEKIDPELQREVVTLALGDNAVRSVPTFGRYDWDSDARELGLNPVNTRLLPSGLRSVAETFLQSSKDAEMERRTAVSRAASTSTEVDPLNPIKRFYAGLAEMLVGFPVKVRIVDDIGDGSAIAAWAPGGTLLLNQRHQDEWDTVSERALGILVHEVAHEDAPHHGDAFRRSVERMAGRLALLCLERPDAIQALMPEEPGQ